MAVFRCERPHVEGLKVAGPNFAFNLGWSPGGTIDSLAVARSHGVPFEAVDRAIRSHPEYGQRILEDNVTDYSTSSLLQAGAREGAAASSAPSSSTSDTSAKGPASAEATAGETAGETASAVHGAPAGRRLARASRSGSAARRTRRAG